MSEAIDLRKLAVNLSINNVDVTTYDERFNIKVRVQKNVLSIQNQCTIEITNINPDERAYLLGQMTSRSLRKNATPFVPVTIEIGRASDGETGNQPRTVFVGAVVQAATTMPPDIGITLSCATSQNDKTKLVAVNHPKGGSFKSLCAWAATQLGVELQYEADDVSASAINLNYTVEGLIGLLAQQYSDRIVAYLDDKTLFVRNINKALNGAVVDVNESTGLIGIPAFNEWGVEFTTLADTQIRLGGGVNLASKRNPNVSGEYVVTAVDYELESRGNSWYANWRASPPAA